MSEQLRPPDERLSHLNNVEGRPDLVQKDLEWSTPQMVEDARRWLEVAEEEGLGPFIPKTEFVANADGSYSVIQEAIEGEAYHLGSEGVVKDVSDIAKKEVSEFIHGAVGVYLKTGFSVEFEKPDSYMLGRNLAQLDQGEGVRMVDTASAFERDAETVVRQIEKAVERFGLDPSVAQAEISRLRREHAQAA